MDSSPSEINHQSDPMFMLADYLFHINRVFTFEPNN